MCEIKEMRWFLRGIVGLLFMVGCSSAPKGVIPERRMTGVLTDLHLLEGYLVSMQQDSMRLVAKQYYQAFYDRHDIDSATLYQSISYYSSKPAVLNTIYAEVQQGLEALEKEEQDKENAKIRERYTIDSLESARLRDSTQRIALDSLRLKFSKRFVFMVDTMATDSLGQPGGTSWQWQQGQDYLMRFLGQGLLTLPYLKASTGPEKGKQAQNPPKVDATPPPVPSSLPKPSMEIK